MIASPSAIEKPLYPVEFVNPVAKHVQSKPETRTSENIRTTVAGGVAGMCSKTAVAPLERIKILLQAHNKHYDHEGVFSGLKKIFQREHFLGLYKGNGAQMIRVFPYAAVQFATFENYKRILGQHFGSSKTSFMAGSLAGVSAVMVTYPLDLARTRLAYVTTPNLVTDLGGHRSKIGKTLCDVFKLEGGYRGLYKGLTPTIVAMIPHSGCTFYFFETFKIFMLTKFPELFANKKGGKRVLNWQGKLICGGISGAIVQPFSYPFDVARRRMQLSMLKPETHKFSISFWKTLSITYKEHGIIKGLYRGMSVNYLRAVPMTAASFTAYEIMKQFFGLETGVRV